tara:strand:+ start:1830 stop:2201 length:372 start_codon:yes stop_codon:yes gene_type:complete
MAKNFLESLCSPSQFYFVISALGLVIGIMVRFLMPNKHNISNDKAFPLYLLSAFGILFFTWVLNWLCKDGYSKVSWAIVLFRYFVMLTFGVCALIAGVADYDIMIMSVYSLLIITIAFSMMKK